MKEIFCNRRYFKEGRGTLVRGGLYRMRDFPYTHVKALYKVKGIYYYVDKSNTFQISKQEAKLNFPGARIK